MNIRNVAVAVNHVNKLMDWSERLLKDDSEQQHEFDMHLAGCLLILEEIERNNPC